MHFQAKPVHFQAKPNSEAIAQQSHARLYLFHYLRITRLQSPTHDLIGDWCLGNERRFQLQYHNTFIEKNGMYF